jgi:hypothetical protein
MNITENVLTKYFEAQKDLVAIESVDERSAIISLPLHFSAHTRVELSVTEVTKNQFVVSDMGQTIGELKDAGHNVTDKVRDRIKGIVQISSLVLDGNTLLRQCAAKQLGEVIHEFADAAKTIGDVYLAYPSRSRASRMEDELKERVRRTFQKKQYYYKEKEIVSGEIERHQVDFYIRPNGAKGLALAILADPDRLHAEAWGFKTIDIRNKTAGRVIVGIIYDDRKVKEISRHIINKMADLPVPVSEFEGFANKLDGLGLSHSV